MGLGSKELFWGGDVFPTLVQLDLKHGAPRTVGVARLFRLPNHTLSFVMPAKHASPHFWQSSVYFIPNRHGCGFAALVYSRDRREIH